MESGEVLDTIEYVRLSDIRLAYRYQDAEELLGDNDPLEE